VSARPVLAAALALAAAAAPAGPVHEGRVVGVADGDTLTLLSGGRELDVRLAEVDTPESGQRYGARAERALRALVGGKRVRVRQVDVDRYGRVVGRVRAGGVDVNAELVRGGHAWVYRRYAEDPRLFALERRARAAGRGLWALERPVLPWEWRRGERPRAGAARAGATAGADRDCSDFSTWRQAQAFFERSGTGDPHGLDGDGDGVACEGMQ